MPRIVHFEIPARDPDSLANFYRNVFGWKIEKWEGPVDYWLVSTGEEGQGNDGALLRTNPVHQTPVNMVDVNSVAKFCEKTQAEGGEVITPHRKSSFQQCLHLRRAAENAAWCRSASEGHSNCTLSGQYSRSSTESLKELPFG